MLNTAKLDHAVLCRLINEIYNKHYGGVCFGSGHMAAQAMLLGDSGIKHFNQRLRDIFKRLVHSTVKVFLDITARPTDIETSIDMLAFLEGIALFHSVSDFPQLLPTKPPRFQSKSLATPLTISKALENLELKYLKSFSGIYNQQELINYLDKLQALLEQNSSPTTPFVMTLYASSHAITVGYDHNKKLWLFFDVNRMPIKYVKKIALLAKNIFCAFGIVSNHETSTLTLVTNPYGISENYKQLSSIVHQWQSQLGENDFLYMPLKVNHLDSLGISWLYMAIHQDQQNIIDYLLANEANPNQYIIHGLNPLHLAIYHGNNDAVRKLLSYGANPNLPTKDGQTSLDLALFYEEIAIICTLLDFGAISNSSFLYIKNYMASTIHYSTNNFRSLLNTAKTYTQNWSSFFTNKPTVKQDNKTLPCDTIYPSTFSK